MNIIPAKIQVDNDCNGITLNISKKLKAYVDLHTSNRSGWMKEAGNNFIKILKIFLFPHLSEDFEGREIITISKPKTNDLEDIYDLITNSQIVCSRSEFYRVAVVFRIIMDTIEDSNFRDLRKLQKQQKKDDKKRNIVRIPMKQDENGETIFKAYKILKRLEW